MFPEHAFYAWIRYQESQSLHQNSNDLASKKFF